MKQTSARNSMYTKAKSLIYYPFNTLAICKDFKLVSRWAQNKSLYCQSLYFFKSYCTLPINHLNDLSDIYEVGILFIVMCKQNRYMKKNNNVDLPT